MKKRMNAWRPSLQQEELLKVVLLPGSPAKEAWEQWRSSADLDRLPTGSYRLLPLVLRRLQSEGIPDPWIGRLKGIYRHTWARNQVILRDGATVVQTLSENGIPVLLLKGAAMILKYYRDIGLCPMNDFDLMVPDDRVMEAIACLRGIGYRAIRRYEGDIPERFIRIGHSHVLLSPHGTEVDLHWHMLIVQCTPGADAPYWKQAVPAEFAGRKVLVPSPTDLLLVTCVRGLFWTAASSLRWVADAALLIHTEEIDWGRLEELAHIRGVTLPLRLSLAYLRQTFGLPIPGATVTSLQSIRTSASDRLFFMAHAGPGSLVWNTLRLWFRHKYFSRAKPANTIRLLVELPEFLRAYWALGDNRGIILILLSKVSRNLIPAHNAVRKPLIQKQHDGIKQEP